MLAKINSHMSIGARLGLVSGLFVASSAFVTSVFILQAQSQIEFSEKEREGTRYLLQVWSAMEQGGRLDQGEAQDLFAAGAAVDSFHAAQGETARILSGNALITAVADGSNLTLDPELDSYYAMEAITVRLPALWQSALELEQAVASTAAPLERELMLNVAAGKLEEAGARAVRSLEASMENNASGGTRQALSERSSELAAAVGTLAAAGRTAQPGQGLDAASGAFRTELGATWRATEAELSRLLDARVSKMRSQMLSQLALIATFLISAGALAWLVASGLAKRFKALTGAMDRLRSGEMDVEIPHSDDRCETGKIAETLDALRKAIIERERSAEAKAGDQTRVVQSLALALKRLSDGDLTCRINESFPNEYEQLRADFNAAMENLLSAMKMIIANASGIRTGAGEISQAADDLSRRTEQQAASLEQTVAALDEITATVRKTAEGSNQANAVVRGARGDAEASGEVVREAVAAMSEIEKSAKQISQIIGVIDEIAFQTNLLALNAGVEAARAGDAGRGFAVVASEVRALAQRSSEAAKEIKGLISASTQHVETGVELVGQAGEALQLIVDKVGEINGLIGRIAASAQEQATGLSQVNTAINQMDQVTQQNAAMVEQSTAASHALTQEAEELMRLISRFSTGESTPPVAAAQLPPPRESVSAQRKRVAAFAVARGNAALKLEGERDDDWQEF